MMPPLYNLICKDVSFRIILYILKKKYISMYIKQKNKIFTYLYLL
jgi:hypothetical protein